jgi:hypothetical protein
MAVGSIVSGARALTVRAARPPPSSSGEGERKAPKKMYYEVKQTTPPQRSLGMHKFPQNTHCGDTIELRNRYFVVDKVSYRYKLEFGKYRKDDTRLYVQEATRYLLNKHLTSLFKGSDAVKDSAEDGRPDDAEEDQTEARRDEEDDRA